MSYFTKQEIKLLEYNGFKVDKYSAKKMDVTITYNNFYKPNEPKEFEYRTERYGYDVDGDYGRGDSVFYETSIEKCIDNYNKFNDH